MKVLMVMTSHDRLGDAGKKTGLWLEEFAGPYYIFRDAGADITLASPNGGQPPIDPRSEEPDAQTPATIRFKQDNEALSALAHTVTISSVSARDYDAVFYPGGHGPLWDLAEDPNSINLIEVAYAARIIVAAVCHGPAAFRHTKAPDGSPLVKGKSVTGFSDTEEAAIGLTHVIPFLVEDMLKENGGIYSKAANWRPHVVVHGNLITGQNPASADGAGRAVLEQLTAEASPSKAPASAMGR